MIIRINMLSALHRPYIAPKEVHMAD